MPENTLPETNGSTENRSEVLQRFHDRMNRAGNASAGAGAVAVGSDPLIAGAIGMLSKSLFGAVSAAGTGMSKLFSVNTETMPENTAVEVNGSVEINHNIEQPTMATPEPQTTEEPKVEKEKDQVDTPGLIERAFEKGQSGVDKASNTASIGAGMLFGSDPIVGAAIGGLTKLLSTGASKTLGAGTSLAQKRRENKPAREKVREQLVENRQTRALRTRMAQSDASVNAAAATAALEKMPQPEEEPETVERVVNEIEESKNAMVEKMHPIEGLGEVVAGVDRIERHLVDGLPNAQEKAEEKLQRRRMAERAEEQAAMLEEIADNTAPEEKKGILGSLGELFSKGGALTAGIGGAIGGLIGSIGTMLTVTLPRLLFAAVKRLPVVALVGSLFKGVFDGAKALMNGESVLGSIMTMINGFADSVIRIFSFGLLNLESLREMVGPAFDAIFDGVGAFFGKVSEGFNLLKDLVLDGVDMLIAPWRALFDKTLEAVSMISNFIESIPNRIADIVPDWAKRFLGIGEEGEAASEARSARLQEAEREYIERTLEAGVERLGPGNREVELTPERREILEQKLERIESGQNVEQTNPIEEDLVTEAEQVRRDRAGAEAYREIIDGRTFDSPVMEREMAADEFGNSSIRQATLPAQAQTRDSKVLQNRINNVVQNNNQTSIITPVSDIRKRDYFSGSMNREVDWRE